MKILQISKYYHPFVGGVEQVARDCAAAMQGSVTEQQVFCFNHEKGDAEDTVDGVKVVRAGCFAKVASQSLSFSYGKLLRRTFCTFRPDAVIFHYPNPFGAHYLKKCLKKFPGCKLVVWWHLDITRQKLLGKLFEGQTKWLLRRADVVVATSPNYIEGSAHLQSVREKCTVIPCCANDARIRTDEAAAARAAAIRAEHAGKTICFAVGRHVPYKGMEYLVRAGKLLPEDIDIAIGGTGPLTDRLRELAKGDKQIAFLGRISDEELRGMLLACDIFCFPSVTKNEAFGIALAEAMAYGKPAVTFTVAGSGVNYVSLNGVTGLECPNADVRAYAEAIETLAHDAALREKMGAAARERVNDLFTYAQFKQHVEQLIHGLQQER